MEFVTIAEQYLKACNINVSNSYLNTQMLSHPDYPSLLSLSDTLNEIQIDHLAVQISKSDIGKLSFPLLIHTSLRGGDFKILKSEEEINQGDQPVMGVWDGVAFMALSDSRPVSKNYSAFINKSVRSNQISFIVGLAIFLLSIASSFLNFNLLHFLFFLSAISAVGVCVLIHVHTMGMTNVLTETLCNSDGNHGCDKVLNSKASKLADDFTVSDIALIYFITLFFVLLISNLSNKGQNVLPFLVLVTSVALPLSFISIWYQGKVLKSWCRMCLIVVGLIWVQCLLLSYGLYTGIIEVSGISKEISMLFATIFICIASMWLILKNALIKVQAGQKNHIELSKWKRNQLVFSHLAGSQRAVDITRWDDDITLGNPSSLFQVMVICNPYCGPCAKSHKELEKLLLSRGNDFGLTIRFSINTKSDSDARNIAVGHVLTQLFNEDYSELNNKNAENVLSEWFTLMDLERWKEKYKNSSDVNQEALQLLLNKHGYWCLENEITHTPSIFINGRELPKQYSISDLQLIIPNI